jgi:hypothetical protein
MGHHESASVHRLRLGSLGAALSLTVAACGGTSVYPTPPNTTAASEGTPPPGSTGTTTGGATLYWTAVTQNTDGTPLTDLAGYKVHYGASPTAMSLVVTLTDPGETTYSVANLSSGTWYFTVAAYTDGGIDGLPSNVAQKAIP